MHAVLKPFLTQRTFFQRTSFLRLILCFATFMNMSLILLTSSFSHDAFLTQMAVNSSLVSLSTAEVTILEDNDISLTTFGPGQNPEDRLPLTFLIANKLYPISTYILFTFGSIGNILTLITLSQKSQRASNSSVYLRAMAVADFLTLLGYFMLSISYYYAHSWQTDTYCKIIFYSQSTFQQISSYLVIMVSFERFFAVKFPLRVGRIFTHKLAMAVSIAIYAVFMALNSPYFLFLVTSDGELCVVNRKHPLYYTWSKIDKPFSTYIPAIAILIINILILVEIHKS